MRLRMTQQRVAEKIAELSTKFQDYGTYNLTRRCSDLERALQQQRNLTSEKEAEITQLREELQASHEHCQALQNKLQQCVDSCEALLISTLTDQDKEMEALRIEIAQLHSSNAALKKEVEALKQREYSSPLMLSTSKPRPPTQATPSPMQARITLMIARQHMLKTSTNSNITGPRASALSAPLAAAAPILAPVDNTVGTSGVSSLREHSPTATIATSGTAKASLTVSSPQHAAATSQPTVSSSLPALFPTSPLPPSSNTRPPRERPMEAPPHQAPSK